MAAAIGGASQTFDGQVGEEAPQLRERVVLVGGLVVDRARARLRARAAERLLVGRLAHRRGDHRRAGDEELRRCRARSREKCDATTRAAPSPAHRPERRRDHRHAGEVVDRDLQAGQERHVREAHLLERLDADPPPPVPSTSRTSGKPEVVRHALGLDHLLPDRRVGRAAADREVVGLDDGAAAVESPCPTTTFAGMNVSSSPSSP